MKRIIKQQLARKARRRGTWEESTLRTEYDTSRRKHREIRNLRRSKKDAREGVRVARQNAKEKTEKKQRKKRREGKNILAKQRRYSCMDHSPEVSQVREKGLPGRKDSQRKKDTRKEGAHEVGRHMLAGTNSCSLG